MFAVHSKKHVRKYVISMMKSQTDDASLTEQKTEVILADPDLIIGLA